MQMQDFCSPNHLQQRLDEILKPSRPWPVFVDDRSVCEPVTELKAAAVLIPLIARPKGVTVLLTERAADLPHHAGQISFPGGQREGRDQTPSDTALREAYEEVGLHPAEVKVIGYMPDYVTGTGFQITPVVGWVTQRLNLKLAQQEVSSVFEAPLTFFMESANRLNYLRTIAGVQRRYFAYEYQSYRVWGATAGMLVNLCQKLQN
jgi:8-oxo-dGTP pyrophosphatase MutT (NUDIX family)